MDPNHAENYFEGLVQTCPQRRALSHPTEKKKIYNKDSWTVIAGLQSVAGCLSAHKSEEMFCLTQTKTAIHLE